MTLTLPTPSVPRERPRARTTYLTHAAIGNGTVIALVHPSTSIEWLCLPRMDSPSVFGALLDAEKGGRFAFEPLYEGASLSMGYLPNSNIVHSHYEGPDGAWELFDYAPRVMTGDGTIHAPAEIVRVLKPLAGEPKLRVVFEPRPDYARRDGALEPTGIGVATRGPDRRVHLITNAPHSAILDRQELTLTGPIYFVVTMEDSPAPRSLDAVMTELDRTLRAWQLWAKTCALPSFASQEVLRSALCLKLHIAEGSGAVIAAATTSIPEELGTPRTWDYRYCWVRDAAFVVDALRRLNQVHEAECFVHYLENIMRTGPLQPVYGIYGERDLQEEFLPHLAGFRGNGYVRIGNAAALQRQNDLMGELVLSLGITMDDPRLPGTMSERTFGLVHRLVEDTIVGRHEPDMGIWEFRTFLKHHTFSRAMCWAAMHRGAVLARRQGHHDLAARWQAFADEERSLVLERGYSTQRGFFTQALDGEFPDASNLLLPVIGIVRATDPRMVATLEAYERLLVRNGHMLRYANVDDLGFPKSAFTICSFWWVELLALQGKLERAIEVFRMLLEYANPHGLFSEDVDPATGELLGNFPQAYTHVGLVHAAVTIDRLLEARDGRSRALA